MTFAGFPERALIFYEGLQADNTKAYWTDHKAVYDECVAAPMRALLDELEPEFGPAKFFRPYRDVRFAKDKTPYKTQAAALAGEHYLAVSADGLFVGGGYWHTSTDQAQRLRAAVSDDRTGSEVAAILLKLIKQGWEISGEQLKRVPKPWDDTHPRADLLRHKALVAGKSHEPAEWLHTSAAKTRIAKAWRQVIPLTGWLHDNVGPAREPRRR